MDIDTRNRNILAEYATGRVSLADLGKKHGLTRESIRMILEKTDSFLYRSVLEKKLSDKSSREALLRLERLRNRESSRRRYFFQTYGCNEDQFNAIFAVFPDARQRFIENRRNAGIKKAEWRLSFYEWARIWVDSGKLAFRSRQNGSNRYALVMLDKNHGYVAWNVAIKSMREIFEGRIMKGEYDKSRARLERS